MSLAALLLTAYAALRYGWASSGGPMGPAFLANKVLALLAFGALGLALAHPDAGGRARAGRRGLTLLLAHLLLSLALLAPQRYPKLYAGGAFTGAFEASLLAGALAAAHFLGLQGPWTSAHSRRVRLAFALAMGHLAALGLPGWRHPAAWPGGLPPLSLLAFAYGTGILAWTAWGRGSWAQHPICAAVKARFRRFMAVGLCLFGLACTSPLAKLQPGKAGPELHLAPVTVEDHSRQLKRLIAVGASEPNTPEARRAALEAHGRWLETAFKTEALARGLRFEPDAPYRLELVVTSLGEVRTKYILTGIASGVAWGVGVGLVAHDTSLAVGLGGYELLEESAFWIGGSSLFGSFSAPAVVQARIIRNGEQKPLWAETYYSLSGRKLTKDLPKAHRGNRTVQLRASLQNVIGKILRDFEAIPGFPKASREALTAPSEDAFLNMATFVMPQ